MEAVRITMDVIDNVWRNEEKVLIDNAVDMTLPVRVKCLFHMMVLMGITSLRYSSSVLLVCYAYS